MSDLAEAENYDPRALRLRQRARRGSALIALISVLPYEVIDGHPQFLWHLIGELPPAGLTAYLAPAFAGLAIFALSLRARRAQSLAWGVLAALFGAAAAIKLGADAAAWEVMALPDSLSQRVALPVLTLALSGAGAALSFDPASRRGSRVLLWGGVSAAVVFYLWPGRGEAPIHTVLRLLRGLPDLPHWQFQVGYGLVVVLLAWPLMLSTFALRHLRRPATDGQPLVTIVAQYGLPLVLCMLVFRMLPGTPEGWDVFTAVGSIVVLVGVVTVLTSALEVAAAHATDAAPGWPAGRARAAAVGAVALVGIAQAVLAAPPAKGVEWAAGGPTDEADDLFGTALPRWNRARLNWDHQARGTTAAQALLEVKSQGRAVTAAAKAIDPGLGEAVAALVKGARTLHVAGRTWHALVEGVNTACRRAGLPYYLDPSVIVFTREGERRRHFRVRSYRVQSVRRFDVAGTQFATLHVERLDVIGPDQPLMGFSRDLQPFALVNLDEVRSFEADLVAGARETPPSCGVEAGLMTMVAAQTCGTLLGRVVAQRGDTLEALAIALTDRHELQHQIDGPHLPVAGAVLDALAGRKSPRFIERVNRELSAYTAELTATDTSPALGLVHLMRFALGEDGHMLDHVARLILGEMSGRWLYTDAGQPDYAALMDAVAALAELSEDALRVRAAKAWAAFYGHALPAVQAAAP